MVQVFSFCIYGNTKKYCQGLIHNLESINEKFPSFEIWIYYSTDVPSHYLRTYQLYKNVKLINAKTTHARMRIYRYFPIDDPKVDILFSRDADSRVNGRDEYVIRAFIKSPQKFHIVRDHPRHFIEIMAGMAGIKKGCISVNIQKIYSIWISTRYRIIDDYQTDQTFLSQILYPLIVNKALIHSSNNCFPNEYQTSIDYPSTSTNFIGNIIRFDKEGKEEYEFFK